MTDSEIGEIKELWKWTNDTQLPFDKQEHTIDNGMHWTCDMWSMEVLRYLSLGESYLTAPYPDYLAWKTPEFASLMKKYGDRKIATNTRLREASHLSNNIVVCEIGRGIDVLLSTFVKKWDSIICYDTNPYYGKLCVDYFKAKNIDIEFIVANSGDIKFDAEHKIVFGKHEEAKVFESDCIIVSENCRFGQWNIESMLSNPNIKAIVGGGHLINSFTEYGKAKF